MKNLTFVTSNENKARELTEALGVTLDRHTLDLDEIQEMDLEKIIDHKARQAYAAIKKPALVEDVALYIEEWKGFPGPFIKWLHHGIGYDRLPGLLSKRNKVLWVCMYGLYDGKKLHTFVGKTKGSICPPRGRGSWGFDIIFVPEGSTKTYAELDPKEKIRTGARGRAVRKLKQFLKKQNKK